MENIVKKYKDNIVLDNIDVCFNSSCSLIIGSNGCGKTTLLKIISGLIKKYSGTCEFKDNTSFLLDTDILFHFKNALDNAKYFLNDDEYKKVIEYFKLFDMQDYINKLVKTYSNGMKKKLMLCIALSKNKDFIILDEPTNSLDIKSIEILKNILIDLKKTKKIIIASHDISIFDLNLIDTMYLLKDHKIIYKNIDDYNFIIYKIKLLNIDNFDYKYIKKDDYFYFKINKEEVLEFAKYISKYVVLEMTKLEFFDEMYLGGDFDD